MRRDDHAVDSTTPAAGERGDAAARAQALWESVDALLARASLPGILAHKLGPLAAHRLRRLGEPLPEPLLSEERAASLCMRTAVPIIRRIRANSEGPLLVLKGPELAWLYPGHARRFSDIDLLTDDAESLQQVLLTRGFVKVHDPGFERFGAEHALNVLRWPPFGLNVEIHKGIHWPRYLPRPPLDEIFDARVPSALGDGLFTPAPVHHALILAAHAWAHGAHAPLWNLRDLVDTAAVSAHAHEAELARTAAAWGIERLWRTTWNAIQAVFYGGSDTLALRLWSRHLGDVRAQRGFERHLCRLVSPYWVAPPHRASLEALRGLRYIIGPDPSETWGDKARRVPQAFRNLRSPVGDKSRTSTPDRSDHPPP